jgi:hypothetical protein
VATSAVRFFLARALAPHVQSANRWTGVNARTRRAFAVAGKDGGSPFLGWMAGGRNGGSPPFAQAVTQLGVDDQLDGDGYLDWYRRLNFDYPFLDYAVEEGREVDQRLMTAYAETEAPPAYATAWPGVSRPLAPAGVGLGAAPPGPGEALLATWLRAAAGYNATSPGRRGPVLHRTSPSGGARHPTELGVALGTGWGDLAGHWWYDAVEHRLVVAQLPHDVEPGSPTAVVVSVVSHVQRAMWRYRDVRAFRPVLYDAGHVIETLIQLVEITGWRARWRAAPTFVDGPAGLDAGLGYLVVDQASAGDAGEPRADDQAPRERQGTRLRTNPFLSVVADEQGVVVTNHRRAGAGVAATGAMLDALAYAIPSSRGDRPTVPASIEAATGAGAAELERLRDAGLLLGDDEGDALWHGLATWISHDWFLSALVHAEATAAPPRRHAAVPADAAPRCDAVASRALATALDRRRTCRALSPSRLPEELAERLLTTLRAPSAVRVVLSTPTGIGDLGPGVHALDAGATTTLSDDALPEADITRAAIGQPWARGFSCAVWLMPKLDETSADTWESRLIDCGRLAQRLVLVASTDPGVGVFQTPAMVDRELGPLLAGTAQVPTSDLLDGAYLIGLGGANDRPPPDRDRAFAVEQLLAWTDAP